MKFDEYRFAMDSFEIDEMKYDRLISAIERDDYRFRRKAVTASAAAISMAAVLGVTAAAEGGAFEWVKGLFSDEVEITDEVTDLIAGADNFSCESNCGIKISPVGIIADEMSLYCMFHVDELPEGMEFRNLDINKFYIDKTAEFPGGFEIEVNKDNYVNLSEESEKKFFISGFEIGVNKDDYGNLSEESGKNTFITKISSESKSFNDGDRVNIRFCEIERQDEHGWCENALGREDVDKYADVSFNINFGNVKSIEKTFEGYNSLHVWDRKMFVEKLTITPLKVSLTGQSIYCDSVNADCDVRIVMEDGSVITNGWSGLSASSRRLVCEYKLDKPVNIDNIKKVYIGDKCIYD